MFTFTIDYYMLVLVAGVGAIQVAASLNNLRGLLFIKKPQFSRALGVALILSAFLWFFSVSERNISDHNGALDANTQALFFFLGISSSGVFTFVLSSVVNRGMSDIGTVADSAHTSGMDSLRHRSFYQALVANLHYWWNNWKTQIRPYLFG